AQTGPSRPPGLDSPAPAPGPLPSPQRPPGWPVHPGGQGPRVLCASGARPLPQLPWNFQSILANGVLTSPPAPATLPPLIFPAWVSPHRLSEGGQGGPACLPEGAPSVCTWGFLSLTPHHSPAPPVRGRAGCPRLPAGRSPLCLHLGFPLPHASPLPSTAFPREGREAPPAGRSPLCLHLGFPLPHASPLPSTACPREGRVPPPACRKEPPLSAPGVSSPSRLTTPSTACPREGRVAPPACQKEPPLSAPGVSSPSRLTTPQHRLSEGGQGAPACLPEGAPSVCTWGFLSLTPHHSPAPPVRGRAGCPRLPAGRSPLCLHLGFPLPHASPLPSTACPREGRVPPPACRKEPPLSAPGVSSPSRLTTPQHRLSEGGQGGPACLPEGAPSVCTWGFLSLTPHHSPAPPVRGRAGCPRLPAGRSPLCLHLGFPLPHASPLPAPPVRGRAGWPRLPARRSPLCLHLGFPLPHASPLPSTACPREGRVPPPACRKEPPLSAPGVSSPSRLTTPQHRLSEGGQGGPACLPEGAPSVCTWGFLSLTPHHSPAPPVRGRAGCPRLPAGRSPLCLHLGFPLPHASPLPSTACPREGRVPPPACRKEPPLSAPGVSSPSRLTTPQHRLSEGGQGAPACLPEGAPSVCTWGFLSLTPHHSPAPPVRGRAGCPRLPAGRSPLCLHLGFPLPHASPLPAPPFRGRAGCPRLPAGRSPLCLHLGFPLPHASPLPSTACPREGRVPPPACRKEPPLSAPGVSSPSRLASKPSAHPGVLRPRVPPVGLSCAPCSCSPSLAPSHSPSPLEAYRPLSCERRPLPAVRAGHPGTVLPRSLSSGALAAARPTSPAGGPPGASLLPARPP
ncbi:unnamed protein product, partial [Rangifer tarandus platyrhynchus]